MAVPAVISRFSLELFESDEWDTEMAVDAERHSPRVASKGVRVLVKGSAS